MKYLNDNYYVTAIIKVLNIKITKNLITKYIDIHMYISRKFQSYLLPDSQFVPELYGTILSFTGRLRHLSHNSSYESRYHPPIIHTGSGISYLYTYKLSSTLQLSPAPPQPRYPRNHTRYHSCLPDVTVPYHR